MPIFENHTGLHWVGEVEFLRCATELLPSLVLRHRGTAAEGQKEARLWTGGGAARPTYLPLSLPFKTLSRFVNAFLPSSNHLLISWLQWSFVVLLEPKKVKSHCFHFLSISLHEVMGLDAMISVFECWVLSQLFHSLLSSSSRGSLVPLHFLPLGWYHLSIWGCWYFSPQSWFQLMSHPAQYFAWCTLHIS